MPQSTRAAIILNSPEIPKNIPETVLICADGGRNALPSNVTPFALIGDFDSLNAPLAAQHIIRCPTDKDYTDGERAVAFAAEQGFSEIVIYGATGGRADHVYANFALLAQAADLGIKAEIHTPNERIFYVQAGVFCLNLAIGTTFSVLPFGDSVTLDHSNGLQYPYQKLTLNRKQNRGISNIACAEQVQFEVLAGSALVFINA